MIFLNYRNGSPKNEDSEWSWRLMNFKKSPIWEERG